MSVNLKPNTPCPKCGNTVWDGPRYTEPEEGSVSDWLTYTCSDCRYRAHITPLDRQKRFAFGHSS